jgi:hypothetical protein
MSTARFTRDGLASNVRVIMRELDPETADRLDRGRFDRAMKDLADATKKMRAIAGETGIEPVTLTTLGGWTQNWAFKTKAGAVLNLTNLDHLHKATAHALAMHSNACSGKDCPLTPLIGDGLTATPDAPGNAIAHENQKKSMETGAAAYVGDLVRRPATPAQAAQTEKAMKEQVSQCDQSAAGNVADWLNGRFTK